MYYVRQSEHNKGAKKQLLHHNMALNIIFKIDEVALLTSVGKPGFCESVGWIADRQITVHV